MTLMDRCDMFFLDYSLVPLLVQENYLKAVENKGRGQRSHDPAIMQRVAFSSELFVSSDTLSNSMRAVNDWSLLPDVAITSCVYPAYITNGFLSFPQFPMFLGKYSTCQKTRRLSQELHAHLRLSTTSTRRAMLTSGYVDLLYKKAMRPLLTKGGDGIDDCMKVMDAYGLGKEHVTEHLPELGIHLGQEDKFKLVDSKVKASMTRELNQGNHAAKVVLPSKKRKIGGGDEAADPDGEDDDKVKAMDADEEEDAKSDEDGGGGSLVKAKKGKGAAKAKAKGKSRGKAKA
jgi:replication factor C subunit 1